MGLNFPRGWETLFFCLFTTCLQCRTSLAETSNTNTTLARIPGTRIVVRLPLCELVGGKLKITNESCVFIPSGTEENVAAVAPPQNVESNDDPRPPSTGSGSDNSNTSERDKKQSPLVPPFLIGASSVIVLYIIIHCLYLHCYTKNKIRKIKARSRQPTIVFDPDMAQGSSIPLTPVVRYETDGKTTEMLETQPFLFYGLDDGVTSRETEGRADRRESASFARLPSFLKRKRSRLTSVHSAAAELQHQGASQEPDARPELRRTRASICFVPVNRTASDPSEQQETGTSTEASARPRPAFFLPRNASFSLAEGKKPNKLLHAPAVVVLSSNSRGSWSGAASDLPEESEEKT